MLPDPLHPAVVHFPIVFAAILPLVAIAALVLIRRGESVKRAWIPVLLLGVLLPGSAWAAVRTGETEEEVVEEVVADAPIHEHEEAAELFLPLSLGLLALVAAGLTGGRIGRAARGLAAVASVAMLIAAYRVGHTGGQLVYEHGASAAYVTAPSAGAAGEPIEHDDRRDLDRASEDREGNR
ncbi:MAG: hypothetical protein OEO23_13405 [Gemmatimonadota bacterium]|nr:hypothetical protein [Gemmatimonadota bacterium]